MAVLDHAVMSERNVLAMLANNRGAYEQYSDYMETADFSAMGRVVYEYIQGYYDRDPECDHVDLDDIRTHLNGSLVSLGPEVDRLLEWGEISLPNAEEAVRQQLLKQRGMALAEVLLTGDPNNATLNDVLDTYYSVYHNTYIQSTTKDTYDDIINMLDTINADQLYSVYPRSLNDHLEGGVPKGTTITVFARPEVGKSLFCINMAAGFCRDGHSVLYVGNEDPKAKMMQRIISRMSGMTKHEVLHSPKDALAKAREKGLDNLDFRSLSPGTIAEVDGLVKETNPDVVIIDQLFNLHVKGCETGSIQAIRQLAPAARAIAKARDCILVSVTQAGDSGDGKAELAMGDIEGSNTAMQAQQDIIIGIGATEQMLKSGHRRLSFPKNKESGKHDSIPIRFEEAIGKVHSIE